MKSCDEKTNLLYLFQDHDVKEENILFVSLIAAESGKSIEDMVPSNTCFVLQERDQTRCNNVMF